MIEAIEKSQGIIAGAARFLGCSRNTVAKWIDQDEKVRQAYEDQKETIGDEMEGRLLRICRSDGHADQFKAIRFYLRTVLRERGYGDKEQKEESTNQPIVIEMKNIPRPEDA
jgi:hypothetical protein